MFVLVYFFLMLQIPKKPTRKFLGVLGHHQMCLSGAGAKCLLQQGVFCVQPFLSPYLSSYCLNILPLLFQIPISFQDIVITKIIII